MRTRDLIALYVCGVLSGALNALVSAGDHVDGLNLWRTLSEGEPSPRTEFVYNIDEVDQNAAIR